MNFAIKAVIALLAAFLVALPFSRPSFEQSADVPVDTVQRLSVLFVGDVMQHQTQLDAARNPVTGAYEYDSCFLYVRDLISSYDVAIANLEVTLAGPPYSGYPQFGSPDVLALALKNAGFDYLGTANNHSCDRGRKGIERTIKVLDSMDIPHVGTYKDSLERAKTYPLIINKNGIKIALLNYTYATNGIPVPSPNIVNMIDEKLIAADLQKAKDSMPDKIIVYTHWGDEYMSQPNAWQSNIADVCFRNGADIVIGSHPHVIQKMERYHYPDSNGKEVMLVYSLGNYISNQRDRYKDGGATVGFELIKTNGKTEIGFSGYYFTWVWIPVVKGRKHYYIVPVSQYENVAEMMDADASSKMKIFIDDSRKLYGKYNIGVSEFLYQPDTKVWKLSDH